MRLGILKEAADTDREQVRNLYHRWYLRRTSLILGIVIRVSGPFRSSWSHNKFRTDTSFGQADPARGVMGLRSATVTLAIVLLGCTQAEKIDSNLPPFHTVQLCAPLNLRIKPSDSGKHADEYQLAVSGKRLSHGSIEANVDEGVLRISTTEAFGVQEDFSITVALPAESLRGVLVQSAGSVFVDAGFVSEQIEISAETLAGAVSVMGLQADLVSVRATGLSEVYVQGEIGTVSVAATDTASISISGVQRAASVSLKDLSKAAIQAAEGAHISGSAEQGRVVYRGGSCSVTKTSGLHAHSCVEDSSLSLVAPTAFLECTISLKGPQTCASGAMPGTGSASKACQIGNKSQIKGSASMAQSRRKLRQSENAFAAAQALLSIGSVSNNPTSYTFTSTSNNGDSGTSVTTCSFVNNQGGCQVNGTAVPVDIVSGPVPAPGPDQQALIARIANSLSPTKPASPSPPPVTNTNVATNAVTTTSSNFGSSGGVSTSSACTFVNGVGGCTTG